MRRFNFRSISLLSAWVVSAALVPNVSLAQTKPAPEQQPQQIPQLLLVQNATAVVTDKSGGF